MLFADAAPTGAGLGIVAAILLAFVVFWIFVIWLVVRTIVRSVRKRRAAAAPPIDPAIGSAG